MNRWMDKEDVEDKYNLWKICIYEIPHFIWDLYLPFYTYVCVCVCVYV